MDKENPLPTPSTDSSELNEDEIDDQLEGTFPASDPPSWTLGIETSDEAPIPNNGEEAPRT